VFQLSFEELSQFVGESKASQLMNLDWFTPEQW
jgi:hypothetical protein